MRDFEYILDSLDLEVDENSILPPPNTKEVSTCVFCSGEIITENINKTGNYIEPVIEEFIEQQLNYHCSNCGLKYKFLPKQKVTSVKPPQGPNIKLIKDGF